MKVAPNMFVRISYSVHGSVEGSPPCLLRRSSLEFIHSRNPLLPALEEALKGVEPGQELHLDLPPQEAFGDWRLELVEEVDLGPYDIMDEVEVGRSYRIVSAAGDQTVTFTVQRKCGERVLADYNHPWAGQRIYYDVLVTEVRPATFMDYANAAERRWYDTEAHCQAIYWK